MWMCNIWLWCKVIRNINDKVMHDNIIIHIIDDIIGHMLCHIISPAEQM